MTADTRMPLKHRLAVWFIRRRIVRALVAWIERAEGRSLKRKERKMLSRIFTNWQTTVAGLVGAVVQAYMAGMSWKGILASLPTLLMGALAKDSNVTGGSVQQ